MGGLFSHLFNIKKLERLATQQILAMSEPELEGFAGRLVGHISDDQLPATAQQLRDLATALDAKDRGKAAQLIAHDLKSIKV